MCSDVFMYSMSRPIIFSFNTKLSWRGKSKSVSVILVDSVCIYVWSRVHLRLDNYFVLSVKSLSVQSWVLKETFSCCRLKFSYLVSMGKVIEQQKEKRFKLCVASLLIIWRTIQPTFIPKCNIIRTKFNSSYRPMFKCWRSLTQKPMRKSILISDIF